MGRMIDTSKLMLVDIKKGPAEHKKKLLDAGMPYKYR